MNRNALTTVAAVYAPRPAFTTAWWCYQIALVSAGSALIALTAQFEFVLPFTPVPVTGQTFGVLVVAALLGRFRGTAAVLTYLSEGALGLPVFAGGSAGAIHVLGPTGGYLLGFLPAAFTVGTLADRGWDRNVYLTMLSMGLGCAVCLAAGVCWLSVYVGWDRVLTVGFYPFIAGDLFKIVAAAALLPTLRRFV